MRKSLLPILCLLFCIAGLTLARAQQPDGWITRYDGGPGGGLERPVGIALDAEGAVYVAGNSGRGSTIVKYDAAGGLLWARAVEGKQATAMALDPVGNLFVGRSRGLGFPAEVVLYDSAGTDVAVWTGFFSIRALEVDAMGHVFVVSDRTDSGFQTAKLDPRSGVVWSRPYVVSGPSDALVLRLDAEGNAHVVVTVAPLRTIGRQIRYVAVKYDPAAKPVWHTRDVPVHESFRVAGAALDESDNLVVAGHVQACDAVGPGPGYALVKYSPEGTALWTACYEPPVQQSVAASAVATDSSGNVYVTGSTCGDGDCAWTTVKYDPDGTLLWGATRQGGRPAAMAVDPGGAIYITGAEESCQGQDCESAYMTVKYAPDGTELWVRVLEPPRGGDSRAEALALDAAGRAYVVGTASKDYGLVTYDPDGREAWRTFHDTPMDRENTPIGIEVGGDTHLYVVGNSCDPEGCNWATRRYDPVGNVVWERRLEGAEAAAMTLDENRSVFVTGRSLDSSGQSVTAKYDAAGAKLWEARTDAVDPRAIGLDLEGNVYITGGERDRALVKYDSDGTELWVSRSAESFTRLEVDPTGYVYVAEGAWAGQLSIALLDHDGDEIWRVIPGGPQWARLQDMALDAGGNLYITGQRYGPGRRQGLARYDQDGQEVWSVMLPNEDVSATRAALRVDAPRDAVYLGFGSCDAGGVCDLVIAKYSSAGAEAWRRRRANVRVVYDDFDAPRPGGIEIDAMGAVYIHGIADVTAKYDTDGNEVWFVDSPDVQETSLALGPDRMYLAGRLRDAFVLIGDIPDAVHVEPPRGTEPLAVRVRAPDLATPLEAGETTYRWDFGDGAEATGSLADHTYERAGAFDLELVSSNRLLTTRKTLAVRVSCAGEDVSPWTSSDIGLREFEGSARMGNEDGSPSVILCSGARDRFQAGDGLHFVYQELSGDVVLTARVSELGADQRSLVGVMVREELDPSSRHASMLLDKVQTSTRFRFTYRDETARRSRTSRGDPAEVPDAWVRIRRQGSELIGSDSVDGVAWQELGRVTLDFPGSVYVGFAAMARGGQALATVGPISVTLDHIELDLDPAPLERPFRRGDANADGDVNLTDATVILGALFAGQAGAVTCEKAGDTNDSGALEISDSVYLLAHLFRAGAAPAAPFGACGVDPTPDSLTCASHEACE